MPETIIIAADHAGVALKQVLSDMLAARGFAVRDLGTSGSASVDYPDFANLVSGAILNGEAARGVVVCGSGIGVSIAANRHKGIRAALCRSVQDAQLSRQHNDANVLCLGERITPAEEAKQILAAFLDTAFEGGRHCGRVEKLG